MSTTTSHTDLARSRAILDNIDAYGRYHGMYDQGDDLITVVFPGEDSSVKKTFQIHRSLLIKASPIFKDMLTGYDGGRGFFESVIDVDVGTFETFYHVLYGGKLGDKKYKQVLACLKFSVKYKCDNEISVCLDWMKENLDKDQLKEIWDLAEDIDNADVSKKLVDMAFARAKDKFDDFVRTKQFRNMPWKLFKRMLTTMEKADKEKHFVLFRYSMKWIRTDYKERVKHLDEILKKIKFSNMTKKEIEKVLDDGIARKCPDLLDIIKESLAAGDKDIELPPADPYYDYLFRDVPPPPWRDVPPFPGPPGPPGAPYPFPGRGGFFVEGYPPRHSFPPPHHHPDTRHGREHIMRRFFDDSSYGSSSSSPSSPNDNSSSSSSSSSSSDSHPAEPSHQSGAVSSSSVSSSNPLRVFPWESDKVAAYFNFHYSSGPVSGRHREKYFMYEDSFWKLKGERNEDGSVGLFLYLVHLSKRLEEKGGIDVSLKMFARHRGTGERIFQHGFSEVNTMKVGRCYGYQRLIKPDQLEDCKRLLMGRRHRITLGVEIKIHIGEWFKGKGIFKDLSF